MTHDGDGPSWCLQVDVPAADADPVSERLFDGGATRVTVLDLEPGRARLVAAVADGGVDAVRPTVAELDPVTVRADHDGWLDAWRPFARPVRVGRIVVHPAWEAPPDHRPGDLHVAIDADRAFGQGNHPTTRLVLTELQRLVEPGRRVLDVGCGSGVLAVAAARLGARVTAIDVEPEALDATRANSTRNGVADRVTVTDTTIDALDGRFDVVAANILPSVLVELAPALSAQVDLPGTLVLSGFLPSQRDRVADAYLDLVPAVEHELEGWCALALRRPHGPAS